MKKLCVSVTALCLVGLLAGPSLGLEIRVAPGTLVLSSAGGSVTVHTDVPFDPALSVSLYVNGTSVDVETFDDDRGNLVAQCTKEAVKDVIGDIGEKFIWVTFALEVEVEGVVDSASEEVRVKQ